MRDLYRVLPWLPSAEAGERGHPGSIPAQGSGRLDNPGLYSVTYLSESPEGATAEVFGGFDPWWQGMLATPGLGPQARRALARFRLGSSAVLDLDEPRNLVDRGMRPSRVVTTDRKITRAWARRIFEEASWAGVTWWSRWDARWISYGIWDSAQLTMVGQPEVLDLDHPAMREAAEILNRPILA